MAPQVVLVLVLPGLAQLAGLVQVRDFQTQKAEEKHSDNLFPTEMEQE